MKKTLKDYCEEIQLLMKYAVPEENIVQAENLLRKFSADIIGLNIFHTFYSYLPDAVDDAILSLRQACQKEGAFLIVAETLRGNYLYISTNENAEYLAPVDEGIWDEEVLDFFGFETRDAFMKVIKNIAGLPLYTGAVLDLNLCPICHVEAGEYHVLGCPVEICPWCDGQLTSCNCRFEKLHCQYLETESQLNDLLDLLHKEGRIPFEPDNQDPSYPELTDVLK